jgi:hypothetical protein
MRDAFRALVVHLGRCGSVGAEHRFQTVACGRLR